MAISINDNLKVNAPKSLDNKYGKFVSGIWQPFDNIAEAQSTVVQAYRHKGLTQLILKSDIPVEYWYRDGVTDGNLIEKIIIPTSVIQSVTGYSVDNTDPINPIVKAIPIAGTNALEPVTGDIEFSSGDPRIYRNGDNPDIFSEIKFNHSGSLNIAYQDASLSLTNMIGMGPQGVTISSTDASGRGLISDQDFTPNITDLDYTQETYVIPRSGTKEEKPITGNLRFIENTDIGLFGKSTESSDIDNFFRFTHGGVSQIGATDNNTSYRTLLNIQPQVFGITSNDPLSQGILGSEDYTVNATDLAFIQKKYVDAAIVAATGAYIPLGGTISGSPVTGDLEINNFLKIKSPNRDLNEYHSIGFTDNSIELIANNSAGTGFLTLSTNALDAVFSGISRGITSPTDYTANITDLDYVQKKYVDANMGIPYIEMTIQEARKYIDQYISEGEAGGPTTGYQKGLKKGAFYKISGVDPELYNDGTKTGQIANYGYDNSLTGYTDGTYIDVPLINNTGVGSGALFEVTIAGGTLAGIGPINGGENYTSEDNVYIDFNSIGGTGENVPITIFQTIDIPIGTTIILQAISKTKLALAGHGEFYTPIYDPTIEGFGIWNNRSSWIIDDVIVPFSGELNELCTITDNDGNIATINLVGTIDSGLFTIVTMDEDFGVAPFILLGSMGGAANISEINVKGYSAGDLIIWGGYTWQNQNGAVGSAISSTILSDDWVKKAFIWERFGEYVLNSSFYKKQIDVIHYDYENDKIVHREDKLGNFADTPEMIKRYPWGNENFTNNQFKSVVWNVINFQGSNLSYNYPGSFSTISDDTIIIGNSSLVNNEGNLVLVGTIAQNIDLSGGAITNLGFINCFLNNFQCNDSRSLWLTFYDTSLIEKTIQKLSSFDTADITSSVDISTATYLFENYPREIYTRSDGAVKIKFMNDSDTLQIQDITD